MLPTAGEEVSAVLVPVPALEPLLGAARRRFDPEAAGGVPAHVTLLYPWLPPSRLGDRDLAALAALAADSPPLDVEFRATRWFRDELLWLAPEPVALVARLLGSVVRRWPELPPYGNPAWRADDLVPHVTVGYGTPDDLAEVERTVAAGLPVATVLDEVWVMQGVVGAAWARRARFPLGTARR